MLNQVVLVGRLTKEPEVTETADGKKVSNIVLAIPRSFKNADGVYDTDFIKCTLWSAIAQNTSEYCHQGDIIGVKGRMQSNDYEKEDGTKQYAMSVVAEKVTFLSNEKHRKQENER